MVGILLNVFVCFGVILFVGIEVECRYRNRMQPVSYSNTLNTLQLLSHVSVYCRLCCKLIICAIFRVIINLFQLFTFSISAWFAPWLVKYCSRDKSKRDKIFVLSQILWLSVD